MKRMLVAFLLFSFPVLALSDGGLYDRNLKANWDNLWDVGAEGAWGFPNTRPEVRLNYQRHAVLPYVRDKADRMMTLYGWDSTSSVIIVFCGNGWIVEALRERGVGEVTCIETSIYIQNNKLVSEDVDIRAAVEATGLVTNSGDGLTIFNALRNGGSPRNSVASDTLDEDLLSKDSRDAVAGKLAGNNIHVLTYDGWLQTYTDAEATALSRDLHSIQGVKRVSHHVYFNAAWVNGIQDKSQAEWELLLPNDDFAQF